MSAKHPDPAGRCMAITGTVWTGNRYCGNRAKTEVEGRPVCGVHKAGNPGTTWDPNGLYPNGPRGRWTFSRGESR